MGIRWELSTGGSCPAVPHYTILRIRISRRPCYRTAMLGWIAAQSMPVIALVSFAWCYLGGNSDG